MPRRFELSGFRQPNGMLSVKGFSHTSVAGAMWDCVCLCGEELKVLGWVVKKESKTNCGCLRREAREKGAQKFEAFGEVKSSAGWVKDQRCVVNLATLRARLKMVERREGSWTIETAIITPSRNKYGGKPQGYSSKEARVPLRELLLARKG